MTVNWLKMNKVLEYNMLLLLVVRSRREGESLGQGWGQASEAPRV